MGLAPGSPQPQSAAAIVLSATQALSALKRYATSGMLAPVVAPRSKGGRGGQQRASQASSPRVAGGAAADGGTTADGGRGGGVAALGEPAGVKGDASGDPSEAGGDDDPLRQLHACKNCQRAKTACNDQRPCARCVRLGVPCDGNMRAVKRACVACKRSKVKCDLDECHPNACSRCTRLGSECTPHVPNKKSKKSKDDDDYVDDGLFGGGIPMPLDAYSDAAAAAPPPARVGGMGAPAPPEAGVANAMMPGAMMPPDAMMPPVAGMPGMPGMQRISSDGSFVGNSMSMRSSLGNLSDGLVSDALHAINDIKGMTGSSGQLPLPGGMMAGLASSPANPPPMRQTSSGSVVGGNDRVLHSNRSDASDSSRQSLSRYGIDDVVNAILGDEHQHGGRRHPHTSSGQLPCASSCSGSAQQQAGGGALSAAAVAHAAMAPAGSASRPGSAAMMQAMCQPACQVGACGVPMVPAMQMGQMGCAQPMACINSGGCCPQPCGYSTNAAGACCASTGSCGSCCASGGVCCNSGGCCGSPGGGMPLPSWGRMQVGSSSNVVAALSRNSHEPATHSNGSLASMGSMCSNLGSMTLPGVGAMPATSPCFGNPCSTSMCASPCGSQASLGSMTLASIGAQGNLLHVPQMQQQQMQQQMQMQQMQPQIQVQQQIQQQMQQQMQAQPMQVACQAMCGAAPACSSTGSLSSAVPDPFHTAVPSMHPTGRPLLPLADVDSPVGWRHILQEGNVRVCLRHVDASLGGADTAAGDTLWLVATDVPAPPATVAAGFRQLVRTWGVHDSVLRNLSVLSDGGGVPPFVTDCACCFEQLFQMAVAPSAMLSAMDFVTRSVWAIARGQHTAALRPAAEAGSASTPDSTREQLSVRAICKRLPLAPYANACLSRHMQTPASRFDGNACLSLPCKRLPLASIASPPLPSPRR